MKFDMNRAWNDAIALFKANREVIVVVAGVFFLLPGFAIGILFVDLLEEASRDFIILAQMVRNASDFTGDELAESLTPAVRTALLLACAIGLVTLLGISTLLGLLNDRLRPTLGEALSRAVKGMPSLLAAILLFFAGFILGSMIIGLIEAPLRFLLGPDAGTKLTGILLFIVLCYVMVRLSMTLPVILLEKVLNPFGAFVRSWKLTKPIAVIGFYFLLTVGYFTISLVLSVMFLPVLREVLGGGIAGMTAVNLISGVVEALVLSLFACVIASIYRQLANTSTASLASKIE